MKNKIYVEKYDRNTCILQAYKHCLLVESGKKNQGIWYTSYLPGDHEIIIQAYGVNLSLFADDNDDKISKSLEKIMRLAIKLDCEYARGKKLTIEVLNKMRTEMQLKPLKGHYGSST